MPFPVLLALITLYPPPPSPSLPLARALAPHPPPSPSPCGQIDFEEFLGIMYHKIQVRSLFVSGGFRDRSSFLRYFCLIRGFEGLLRGIEHRSSFLS